MRSGGRTAIAAAALLALSLSPACGRRSESPEEESGAPAAAAARYPITGTIRALDPAKSEITLDHDPVEGFMGGMTMPFPARAARETFSALRVGDRIAATLVVEGERHWIEGIAKAEAKAGAETSASPSATPRPNRGTPIGKEVADFRLTDQAGRTIRLSDFRGQPVAVTFLYTRCPIATACPMTTAKFSKLDAMLGKSGWGALLTVTVDPEHDTPAVLAEYAKRSGADPKRWKFLTGDPKAVADVAERFGVLYYPDRGEVVHQQAVAVLDAQGKLANIYYGENWEPEHIFRDMEKARRG